MKLGFSLKKFSCISLYLLLSSGTIFPVTERENAEFVENFFSYVKSEVPGFRVPKNLVITGDLNVSKNQTIGATLTVLGGIEATGDTLINGDLMVSNGSLTVTGDFNIQDSISCSNLTVTDTFTVDGDISINTNSDTSGIIQIGSPESGKVLIDSGTMVSIGDSSSCPINIGNSQNTTDIQLSSDKTNGKIKFSAKSIQYDVTDVEKPESGFYKYLAVDEDGNLLTLSTAVGGDSLEINDLTVNNSTVLNGTININSNLNGITTISGSEVILGKADAQNLGIFGKSIQLGSEGVVIIGYVEGEDGGPVQINGNKVTVNGSDLILDFSSIEKPEDDQTSYYLRIDKDGKVSALRTLSAGNDETASFDNLSVDGEFVVNGNVNINTTGSGDTSIGNADSALVSINSGETITITSNQDIEISGENLKLDFSDITLPDCGRSYLKISNLGKISSEPTITESLSSETYSALTVTSTINVLGTVNINNTGNYNTNIGTGTYSGTISIGNSSAAEINLNSGNGDIKIGENATGDIILGNDQTTSLVSLTTKNTGKITLSSENIILDISNLNIPTSSNKYYLYVDSDRNLASGAGIVLEEGQSVVGLEVTDSTNIIGVVNINSDSANGSETRINGESILIGDSDTNDLQIYASNTIISSRDTLLIGTDQDGNSGNVQITGGDVTLEGSTLVLGFANLAAADGDLSYLAINREGVITSVPLNREPTSSYVFNGNFQLNATGSGTTTIGNNTNGGAINIASQDDIIIEGDNLYLTASGDTGSIIITSDDIARPGSGTIALKINSDGVLVTDVSSRRFKKNIKNLLIDRNTIKSLSFKKFNYLDGRVDYGLIAEDLVGTGLEKAIIFGEDGRPLSINYRMIFSAIFGDYLKACEELEILKQEQDEIEKVIDEVYELYSVDKN